MSDWLEPMNQHWMAPAQDPRNFHPYDNYMHDDYRFRDGPIGPPNAFIDPSWHTNAASYQQEVQARQLEDDMRRGGGAIPLMSSTRLSRNYTPKPPPDFSPSDLAGYLGEEATYAHLYTRFLLSGLEALDKPNYEPGPNYSLRNYNQVYYALSDCTTIANKIPEILARHGVEANPVAWTPEDSDPSMTRAEAIDRLRFVGKSVLTARDLIREFSSHIVGEEIDYSEVFAGDPLARSYHALGAARSAFSPVPRPPFGTPKKRWFRKNYPSIWSDQPPVIHIYPDRYLGRPRLNGDFELAEFLGIRI